MKDEPHKVAVIQAYQGSNPIMFSRGTVGFLCIDQGRLMAQKSK